MDGSGRKMEMWLAITIGLSVALLIVILLILGGRAAVIAASGVGIFVGTSGLVLGIMSHRRHQNPLSPPPPGPQAPSGN